MKTTIDKLHILYDTALGTTVGILPLLAIYLINIKTDSFLTYFFIWLLTSTIVINEWWAVFYVWKRFPPDKYNKLFFEIYEIIFHIVYMLGIIALPISLQLKSSNTIDLFFYGTILGILPAIDFIILLPYLIKDKRERKEIFWKYIFWDIIAVALFSSWLIFPYGWHWSNFWQITLLYVAYTVEYFAFYFFPKYVIKIQISESI